MLSLPRSSFGQILQWTEQLFFNHCTVCHTTLNQQGDKHLICQACYHDLPWLTDACHYCGLPLLTAQTTSCGQCLQHEHNFNRFISLFLYTQPVDRLISDLKFRSQLPYARLFGELLAQHIAKQTQEADYPLPQCLIPVPLHRQRLQQRGFNQALEIARPISRLLKIPIELRAVKRLRATLPQSATPAKHRSKNLEQSFNITTSMPWQHVAIVDDVVTTMATIRELANTLHKAGVSRIDVWCCARTVLTNRNN